MNLQRQADLGAQVSQGRVANGRDVLGLKLSGFAVLDPESDGGEGGCVYYDPLTNA